MTIPENTPKIPAPTFLDILRGEVARMQAFHPERLGELARAHALIVDGAVIPAADDPQMATVLSSDGHTQYSVNGVCECHAGAHGKACKHLQAWKLYQYVAGKMTPTLPSANGAVPDTLHAAMTEHAQTMGVLPQFIVPIKGKPFVLFVGLLDLAHRRGLQSLQADWTYNDPDLSLAHAVAVFPFGTFEESGDATMQNVGPTVTQHFRRVALTRASARALRLALNVGVVAAEELE